MRWDNVSIHRARTNTLNIETRPRKGSVCNALLSAAAKDLSLNGHSGNADADEGLGQILPELPEGLIRVREPP